MNIVNVCVPPTPSWPSQKFTVMFSIENKRFTLMDFQKSTQWIDEHEEHPPFVHTPEENKGNE